jgi:hypothetical protein
MNQLISHLIGDYILQSTWMALNKSKVSWICALHCFSYTVPFVFVTQSWPALGVIFATHFLIDRFGLARYLIWLKEGLRPGGLYPWHWSSLSGYFDQEKAVEWAKLVHSGGESDRLEYLMSCYASISRDPNQNRPIWIRIWLLIITDNTLHLLCNFLAITCL